MAALFLVLIHERDRHVIRAGLQNDTAFSFVLNGEITFNGPDPVRLAGNVAPYAIGDFGEIPFDLINDYPHFELELERYSTRGQEEEIRKKIKPKPRHFIQLAFKLELI